MRPVFRALSEFVLQQSRLVPSRQIGNERPRPVWPRGAGDSGPLPGPARRRPGQNARPDPLRRGPARRPPGGCRPGAPHLLGPRPHASAWPGRSRACSGPGPCASLSQRHSDGRCLRPVSAMPAMGSSGVVSRYPAPHPLNDKRMSVNCLNTMSKRVEIDQSCTHQRACEDQVFLTTSDQFRYDAVVWFQAQSAPWRSRGGDEGDYTVAPAFREYSSGNADPLSVEAECLVEVGQFPDGPVNKIRLCLLWIAEERDIGLHGCRRLDGQLVFGEAAENRLAADNEHVRIISDPGRGPQDMLKLLSGHAACSLRQWLQNAASAAALSSCRSTPANGLFCRSSIAQGAGEVRALNTSSSPASITACHLASHSAVMPPGWTCLRR